jgi:hypothetical protein
MQTCVVVFWVNECKTLEGTAGGQLDVLVNHGGGLQVDGKLLECNSDVGGINKLVEEELLPRVDKIHVGFILVKIFTSLY